MESATIDGFLLWFGHEIDHSYFSESPSNQGMDFLNQQSKHEFFFQVEEFACEAIFNCTEDFAPAAWPEYLHFIPNIG